MAVERLGPITGEFPPKGAKDDDRPPEIEPHEGFNKAWDDALNQAAANSDWRAEQPVWVNVEFQARIDIWNPGGIGHYLVVLTPRG
jgi:hypothetical protein